MNRIARRRRLLPAWALLAALVARPAGGQPLLPTTVPAEGQWQVTRTVPADAGSPDAPLLFCIGLHVEPLGARISGLVGEHVDLSALPPHKRPLKEGEKPEPPLPGLRPPAGDYSVPPFFRRHVQDIRDLAAVVEKHRGRLAVQVQTPFTQVAARNNDPILTDLLKAGHEISLHFHEDAHLARECEKLPTVVWAAVMKEEIAWIVRACPGAKVRYWSGGNLYPKLLEAAAGAGLDVMSDHKNPRRQATFPALLAVHPWRPAGGPTADNIDAFARHDPKGRIVYLPDGIFADVEFGGQFRDRRHGGPGPFFDFLTDGVERSLRAARTDRVNVFHITVHPGEYRGRPGDKPFQVMDDWLTKVVDPLAKAGRVRWATFSEMADAYLAWEKADPRSADRP